MSRPALLARRGAHPVRLALGLVIALVLTLTVTAPTPSAQAAPPHPHNDPFYVYDGTTPLAQIAPGTVLKTRKSSVHLAGLPLPVQMIQLLYRTTDALSRPTVTATSVLLPPVPLPLGKPALVSYQSFYDSLTPLCQPSYAMEAGLDRGLISTGEIAVLVSALLQGYPVVTSDFEGQDPAFATGPVYGPATLDGIRAAINSPDVGLPADIQVGMVGYSGGAIATEWATEMAPTYAPDINERLVGSAIGGVFVYPMRNLEYISGSLAWPGIMAMAFLGISKAFEEDLTPYLSDYGKQVTGGLKDACIVDAYLNPKYAGMTFQQLVKPEYADPRSIPKLVELTNRLIMGRAGTPTVPMMIRMGTLGEGEGTMTKPDIGAGDAVMIAGDVRTLARKYCAAGVPIDYREDPLSHIPYGAAAIAEGMLWLRGIFEGGAPANNCASIKPGNPIDPIPVPGRDQAAPEQAKVVKVRNGRAIKLRLPDGRTTRVRIVGVKAPVTGCGARASRRSLAKLAPVGSTVLLTRDSRYPDTTARGRSWRYVSHDGVDVGRKQLKRGWASLAKGKFDRRKGYRSVVRKADAAGRGVWGRC